MFLKHLGACRKQHLRFQQVRQQSTIKDKSYHFDWKPFDQVKIGDIVSYWIPHDKVSNTCGGEFKHFRIFEKVEREFLYYDKQKRILKGDEQWICRIEKHLKGELDTGAIQKFHGGKISGLLRLHERCRQFYLSDPIELLYGYTSFTQNFLVLDQTSSPKTGLKFFHRNNVQIGDIILDQTIKHLMIDLVPVYRGQDASYNGFLMRVEKFVASGPDQYVGGQQYNASYFELVHVGFDGYSCIGEKVPLGVTTIADAEIERLYVGYFVSQKQDYVVKTK
jgi:hypothetical protein